MKSTPGKEEEQIQKGLPVKIQITSGYSDRMYLLLTKYLKKQRITVLSENEYEAEKKAFFTAQFSRFYKETITVTREEIMSSYNKTPPVLQDLLVHFYLRGNDKYAQLDSIKWQLIYFPENRRSRTGIFTNIEGGGELAVVIEHFVKTLFGEE